MKQLLVCLCLTLFVPALKAQITIEKPISSFYSGATFSVFYFDGQFYAVQHETAPAFNLSTDFRIVQAASQTLVVVDEFSRQTHTFMFEQPANANEYRVHGIILFHGREFEQMLLNIGPDGFRRELNSGYLSSIDSGEGLQAINCFCVPEHEPAFPCASDGDGASQCRVNFGANSPANGCWTTCAKGYHACCNLR